MLQYIILDGKKPTHKFKDGDDTKTWEEVKDFDNVAVVVPKGYIVLDFDTTSDAETMLKIVDGVGLKCKVMKTTRGIHCWFKSPEEDPKNFIKNRLAVGIYCDRKSGGRNAYVKVKQDGKPREWIRKVKSKDIEVLPKWLTSVSAPSGKFEFKAMGEGSGRNQELFNYIIYLQTKRFNKTEIKETIQIINDYVFDDPLPESEIATICRDEAFKSEDVIEEQIKEAEDKKYYHIDIGNNIIASHNLISVNGTIYEYAEGYYQPADYLRKYIRMEYFGAKNNQVNEIVSYIKDMKEIRSRNIKVKPYILNLINTRLDIRTLDCLEFTPEAKEFDRIPVTYDPSAYCADLDKMLNTTFCGDREVINLFEEMLGAILIKHNRFQKAFLFYGSGSNGKSTILNLIKTFLGPYNYSAISLDKVTDRFNTAELEHKLANIGDDIDNVTIKDTGTLKKLFSGNAVTVERKGERPYTLEPYATHIYSCNAIPRSMDKSEGFYRRWIIIPFNAKFTPGEDDYDPMIEDKITSPEGLSYLLNMGIRGAKRLMKNGEFTEPQIIKDTLEAYKTDNSTVLSWIADTEHNEDYFLDKPRNVIYSEFSDWCKVSGIKSANVPKNRTFYKEVANKFDFDKSYKQKSDGNRYFIQKI